MAVPPDFTAGSVLTAAQMNKVGMWIITPSGATNGTVSGNKVVVGNAVSSVTVSGAFTADFDTYVITYTDFTKSTEGPFALTLGTTATGYYGNFVYGQYANTGVYSANDNNSTRFTYVGGGDNFNGGRVYCVVSNPYLAKQTYIFASVSYSFENGTYNGRLANSNSYTSFKLEPTSGTITGGNVYVYGYNNG